MFLKAFYYFLKALIWITFRIYLKRIHIINKPGLNLKGPFILVSNHPNTLFDPIVIVIHLREQVFFLANYGLFKNPVSGFLLNQLYCIPIQRSLDVGDGKLQNDDAFRRCDEHLMKGGNLYIAAEGTSFIERHVREFKTGAARIALSAESKHDLNLKILPVGLSYIAPTRFRGEVVIDVGEPISVSNYTEQYKTDPRAAVNQLTDAMQVSVEAKTINCRDEAEDHFLQHIEAIAQTEKPAQLEEAYDRSRVLLKKLHGFEETDSSAYQEFREAVNDYFKELENKGLTDAALTTKDQKKLSLFILYLFFGFPLFLYGAFNNLIQALIPDWLVKKMNIYIGYTSTIKFVSSLVLFPLFYYLQIRWVAHFFYTPWITWVYALSLMPMGLFAWGYRERWMGHAKWLRFQRLKRSAPDEAASLLAQRKKIMDWFEKL